ncbi:MAG TPA: acyltransferase, partial [Pseudorhodoplanes sp.]|nr:acyltransferase [Pseudorhodoplanes sp.]
AILLVIVGHFAPSGLTHLLGTPALSLMAYGGVILFFVLSGFLMDRTLAADRNFVSYAIRRVARILPLYWVSLLVAFALGAWTLRDLALNAFFLVPLARSELMSGVYWTLYIEVLFYALAPLLVYAGDRAIVISLYLVIAADVAVFFYRGVPSHALYHLSFCLLGMSFGAWHRKKLTDFGLVLAAFAVTAHATLSPQGVFVALAPLASAVLMWFGLRYVANIAPLSFLGAVSYGWYLLHAVIGLPLMAVMLRSGVPDWQAALAAALVSLLAAWVAHLLIEKPGIAFGRRLRFRKAAQ